MNKQKLDKTFSTRDSFRSFGRALQALPDPDPILQATGNHIEAYRKLTTDAHVFANIQQRKAGTTMQKWRVTAGDNPEHGLFAEQFLNEIDIDSLFSCILDAVFYGYSVLEITWDFRQGKWYPAAIEEKPQEWFYFNDNNELIYRGNLEKTDRQLPPNKFIIVQHQATYANPFGEKILSRCFWPVTFKRSGFDSWVTFTEKYGMPFLLAKIPRTASREDSDNLLATVQQMMTDTYAVLPDDSNISFLDSSKTYTSDVYKKLLEFCNSEISKAIIAQTLTTEVQSKGTYAAAKTHLDIYHTLVHGDKRLVEKTVSRLIRMAVNLNFPCTTRTRFPRFELFEETEINSALAERDRILQLQGISFTKQYYKKYYNLSEEEFLVNG